MVLNLDNVLGIHPQALILRARRTEVLSANIANADTPNYKARDVDFRAVLAESESELTSSANRLERTNSRHLALDPFDPMGGAVKFRVPTQPALDGNTVDVNVENTKFSENAVHYMASLQFLGRRVQGIISALKGE